MSSPPPSRRAAPLSPRANPRPLGITANRQLATGRWSNEFLLFPSKNPENVLCCRRRAECSACAQPSRKTSRPPPIPAPKIHRAMSCHEESAAATKTGQPSCICAISCTVNGRKCATNGHKRTTSLSCHKSQRRHPVTSVRKFFQISDHSEQIVPSDTLSIPYLSPNRCLLRTQPVAVQAKCGPNRPTLETLPATPL